MLYKDLVSSLSHADDNVNQTIDLFEFLHSSSFPGTMPWHPESQWAVDPHVLGLKPSVAAIAAMPSMAFPIGVASPISNLLSMGHARSPTASPLPPHSPSLPSPSSMDVDETNPFPTLADDVDMGIIQPCLTQVDPVENSPKVSERSRSRSSSPSSTTNPDSEAKKTMGPSKKRRHLGKTTQVEKRAKKESQKIGSISNFQNMKQIIVRDLTGQYVSCQIIKTCLCAHRRQHRPVFDISRLDTKSKPEVSSLFIFKLYNPLKSVFHLEGFGHRCHHLQISR